MIKKVKKVSEKEAVDKKTGLASKEQVKKTISQKRNQYYDTLWTGIVFEYKEQNEGGKKLIAKMPSGKYIMLDKGEDSDLVKAGIPYVCLLYEPTNEKTGKEMSVAFAKVVCEESIPKILIHPEGSVYMIYKDDKGNFKKKMIANKTFNFRIIEAIKEFEKLGFEEARIVYMANKMKKANKVKEED